MLFERACELVLPESCLVASETRLMNCYTPQLEEIRLREVSYPTETVRVTLHSDGMATMSGKGRLRHPLRKLEARRSVEGGDAIWVDGRKLTAYNISLFLQHAVVPYFLAKSALATAGHREPLKLLVESKLPGYALEVLRELGVDHLVTDRQLNGKICKVEYGKEIELRALMKEFSPRWDCPTGGSRRVYVGRKESRRVLNEEEVLAYLRPLGFDVVYFEGLSVREQWKAVADAEVVVAVHGAGVANLLARQMARPGEELTLIELFGPGYVVEPYRKLCAAMGWRYVAVRGHITPEVIRDLDYRGEARRHATADFKLSVKALERAIAISGVTAA